MHLFNFFFLLKLNMFFFVGLTVEEGGGSLRFLYVNSCLQVALNVG